MMKFAGSDWRDGTAMYYVVHMEDHFGKLFHPDLLFGYMGALKFLTYKTTLVLETLAPLFLWFDRTRNATLLSPFVFHLGINLSMNLEMFHWVMIVGWLSFLVQPLVLEYSKAEPTEVTAQKIRDDKVVDEGAKGKEGGTEKLETKEKITKTKKKGKKNN
jgi:hypothetical protein